MIASPQLPHKCPNCGASFVGEVAEALPFCSIRCQQVDLRRWLGEEYGLPYESDEPEECSEDDLDTSQGTY